LSEIDDVGFRASTKPPRIRQLTPDDVHGETQQKEMMDFRSTAFRKIMLLDLHLERRLYGWSGPPQSRIHINIPIFMPFIRPYPISSQLFFLHELI
jgi:hypothetical protein